MKRRMLPPANPAYATRTVNGRTYTGTAGTPVAVIDCDALMLSANGWSEIALSGSTAERPPYGNVTSPYQATPGMFYWDETLSQLIVFAADLVWRDPATGNAV